MQKISLNLGPMIFRDQVKQTEFAEYTLWNRIAYFKVKIHIFQSVFHFL